MVRQVVSQLSMLHFTLPSAITLVHDAFGFQCPFLQLLLLKPLPPITQQQGAFYFPIEPTE